jgi:hypothetical protein
MTLLFFLAALGGSYVVMIPFRKICQQIPSIANEFLANPSPATATTLKTKIQSVLVSAHTKPLTRTLAGYSKISSPLARGEPSSMILWGIGVLFALPGTVIVILSVDRVLAASFSPFLVSVPASTTLFLIILLFVVSGINFVLLWEEQQLQAPFWKTLGTRTTALTMIPGEFSIYTRIGAIVALGWTLVFGRRYKSNLVCTDSVSITNILEESLSSLLGDSLVFFYNFNEIYPQDQLKALERMDMPMGDYIREMQPVAFIGVHEDRCVLIAHVQKLDVRRMTLWAESNVLAANIVTKLGKTVLRLKPYEEN